MRRHARFCPAMIAAALATAASARPTADQSLYDAHCMRCHGGDMRGSETAPPLIGSANVARWRKRGAALVETIQRTMPQDDPNTLTPAQAQILGDLILRGQPANLDNRASARGVEGPTSKHRGR